MFDFIIPNITVSEVSEDKKHGRFVIEPLERGYGTTLGNSLRRIMLSSLPGTAVSQVKIDGVLHEFSCIPGVKEDVTEIILNIKNLAIRNTSSSDEPKTAYIEFMSEGTVTGADIDVDSDIEIINPDQVIATLNGGADCKLSMELTITNGRGYVSADKGKRDDMPIGVIAVDAIYTPVERVNMTVENTRVGQDTDYDKLTLDVWTNGTLTPDMAVSMAAKVLSDHLRLFIDLSDKPLLLSVCMNIAFLAIYLAIGNGKFNSLDDYFMSSVLTGAYGGQYDVHMYFINVIYGYFLKPFYALFPNVGWYSVFQTFTVFASFTTMCFVAIERFGKKLGTMLAIMLLICVSPDFYLNVAFTQCAGIATAAGIFLFAIGNIERKRSYVVAACAFMLVGIIFRINMFQLGMPTLAAILFFNLIREKSIWKGSLIALASLALVYVAISVIARTTPPIVRPPTK